MTTTSAQNTYSTGLTTEQLDALSSIDTITLTSGTSSYYTSGTSSTYTIGNLTSGSSICFPSTTSTTSSYCIPNIDLSNIAVWGRTEWVDSFPAWARIEKMCDEYPGLKVAFEKFKNTYNLVKDDYDSPPEKRIKP